MILLKLSYHVLNVMHCIVTAVTVPSVMTCLCSYNITTFYNSDNLCKKGSESVVTMN